jgi:predicted MFS family arabinose efflux permease
MDSGIFWATEGATIIAYPEPNRRGKAVAVWFSLNQFGSVIGGSINQSRSECQGRPGWRYIGQHLCGLHCYSVLLATSRHAALQSTPGDQKKRANPDIAHQS